MTTSCPRGARVSPALIGRLRAWNDHYGDETKSASVSVAWNREGLALAQALQREFDARGIPVEVLYHDIWSTKNGQCATCLAAETAQTDLSLVGRSERPVHTAVTWTPRPGTSPGARLVAQDENLWALPVSARAVRRR